MQMTSEAPRKHSNAKHQNTYEHRKVLNDKKMKLKHLVGNGENEREVVKKSRRFVIRG